MNDKIPMVDGKPQITNQMKAECMGEFELETQQTCSACYYDEPDENCEVCGGTVSYVQSYQIPWDTMKDIYKMMATVALQNKA